MTYNKPSLLIFSDWYYPAYKAGGPVTSLKNLTHNLKEFFDIYVITGAYDVQSNKYLPEIVVNEWQTLEGIHVLYLSKNKWTYTSLKKHISYTGARIWYLNSLFSVYFTLLPLLLFALQFRKTKVFLAPRGMLGQGALGIKARKKKLFLRLAYILGLYKRVHWHATALEEQQEIIQNFGTHSTVFVIPNLTSTPALQDFIAIKPSPVRKFLFCSRISPKKNLLYALQCFQEINTPYELNIVGPAEDDEYYNTCVRYTENHSLFSVHFLGAKTPVELSNIYLEHDFFILPTLHENFGHVIVEALQFGLPVIISNQTPWRNLSLLGIGWDIDLKDKNAFIRAIQQCLTMSTREYDDYSQKAKKFAQEHFNTEALVKEYKNMFLSP